MARSPLGEEVRRGLARLGFSAEALGDDPFAAEPRTPPPGSPTPAEFFGFSLPELEAQDEQPPERLPTPQFSPQAEQEPMSPLDLGPAALGARAQFEAPAPRRARKGRRAQQREQPRAARVKQAARPRPRRVESPVAARERKEEKEEEEEREVEEAAQPAGRIRIPPATRHPTLRLREPKGRRRAYDDEALREAEEKAGVPRLPPRPSPRRRGPAGAARSAKVAPRERKTRCPDLYLPTLAIFGRSALNAVPIVLWWIEPLRSNAKQVYASVLPPEELLEELLPGEQPESRELVVTNSYDSLSQQANYWYPDRFPLGAAPRPESKRQQKQQPVPSAGKIWVKCSLIDYSNRAAESDYENKEQKLVYLPGYRDLVLRICNQMENKEGKTRGCPFPTPPGEWSRDQEGVVNSTILDDQWLGNAMYNYLRNLGVPPETIASVQEGFGLERGLPEEAYEEFEEPDIDTLFPRWGRIPWTAAQEVYQVVNDRINRRLFERLVAAQTPPSPGTQQRLRQESEEEEEQEEEEQFEEEDAA